MTEGDTALARFLRARRARLDPTDYGLPVRGRRRTPGLRREEVAALAGLSVEYLIRLEQGRSSRPSVEIVDALARVLRLDGPGHRHLRLLAGAAPPAPPAPATTELRPGLLEALDALAPRPAYLVSPHLDLLAATPAARAMLGPLGAQPNGNFARWYFLDRASRDHHPDWEADAANCLASLRAADRPDGPDPRLDALVAELDASPDFRRMWADHDVRACSSGYKRFSHPAVGTYTMAFEAFTSPDQSATLALFRPAGDERSRTAFELLTTVELDFV